MKVSRAVVAMVAACLIVGLSAIAPSAATAASGKDTAKAKSAQSATTINRRLNTARKQLATTRRQVSTARRQIRNLLRDLGLLTGRVRNSEGGLGTLLGAAPQLITSLQTLGNVVQNQIGPGLTTLANTVRDTIGPGLQRVGDFVAAQEYGTVGVYTAAPGDAIDDSCCRTTTVQSGDIPDSGNTTMASGTLPIQVTPTASENTTYPNAVNPGAKLTLRAAIKSAENDGNATGDPAGQVGGLMTVTCAGGGGNPGFCGDDGNPGVGQADIPAGVVVCVVGPSKSNDFPIPGGTTTQSLVNIQEKSGLTDSTVPAFNFGPKLVNVLADAQNAAGSGNAAEGSCAMPNAFGLYQVEIQTQFADIPTSATPGPKD